MITNVATSVTAERDDPHIGDGTVEFVDEEVFLIS